VAAERTSISGIAPCRSLDIAEVDHNVAVIAEADGRGVLIALTMTSDSATAIRAARIYLRLLMDDDFVIGFDEQPLTLRKGAGARNECLALLPIEAL